MTKLQRAHPQSGGMHSSLPLLERGFRIQTSRVLSELLQMFLLHTCGFWLAARQLSWLDARNSPLVMTQNTSNTAHSIFLCMDINTLLFNEPLYYFSGIAFNHRETISKSNNVSGKRTILIIKNSTFISIIHLPENLLHINSTLIKTHFIYVPQNSVHHL